VASLLIRGFALGFAIAASPGPIFFLCLRRSLLRGWLTGLVSGLGVATADAFYAAVAVFGVAAVVTTTLAPVARWLALAGGLALVFIVRSSAVRRRARRPPAPRAPGLRGLTHRSSASPSPTRRPSSRSPRLRRLLAQG